MPVVIDISAWDSLQHTAIKSRKYLKLENFTEMGVKALSKRITSELFSLICRDIQILRDPSNATKSSTFDQTEKILGEIADLIQSIVFEHRNENPIAMEDLAEKLSNSTGTAYSESHLEAVMHKIIQNDLIPGLVYDGLDLYVEEEHYKWKRKIGLELKRKIAKRITSRIHSGSKIAMDAGSTADEIARLLCKRIQNKSLANLTIVTNSLSVANIFLETGTALGFDDDSATFCLYLAGGKVRPNTLAIVGLDNDPHTSLRMIFEHISGVDLAIIGVNGIHPIAGFTTNKKSEADNKRCLIEFSSHVIIAGDSSKIGLIEDVAFASFEDNVTLITDRRKDCPMLDSIADKFGDKLECI